MKKNTILTRIVFLVILLLNNFGCNQAESVSSVLAEVGIDSTPLSVEEEMTEELMILVNNHRINIGKRPLEHLAVLGAIARTHSEDMASNTVAFGHTGFSQRCSEARIVIGGGNLCAENVAMGQKTVAAAFNSWMDSSGHRANLEQSRVTHTGFGLKQSSTGTYYWTQIFIEKN
jgi:uncharacterized protein YkwD